MKYLKRLLQVIFVLIGLVTLIPEVLIFKPIIYILTGKINPNVLFEKALEWPIEK